MVPTDKTNLFQVIKLREFETWVNVHLLKAVVEVPCPDIISLHNDAVEYAEKSEIFLQMASLDISNNKVSPM